MAVLLFAYMFSNGCSNRGDQISGKDSAQKSKGGKTKRKVGRRPGVYRESSSKQPKEKKGERERDVREGTTRDADAVVNSKVSSAVT